MHCRIPPVLCFPILVGLGLDYHIFLLARVVEYRSHGYSDRESALLALAKTGRLITMAGLIMAVAFLGLLPAYEPLMSQLAWLVIIAVLVDTFVVRALVVPCLIVVIGRWNWWPRRMPVARIETRDEVNVEA